MAEPAKRVKPLWARLAEGQARRVALWSPVAIGCGVWLSFVSRLGLSGAALGALFAVALSAAILARRAGRSGVFLTAMTALLILAGSGAAEQRRAAVAAPVLETRYAGAVTARIVATDRSRSEAPRVMLDRLALDGLHAVATPHLVRVTLVDLAQAPPLGARVAVDAVLGPPSGPAEPGAFDFSRRAAFLRIGAVGYARGAVEILEPPAADPDAALRLAMVRAAIAGGLRSRIGGDEGAVAAALVVGDRSGIAQETTQALRDSGLAHLLAISGLHIGLMSALTYWLVRLGLAFFPVFASRVPIRKLAAVAGLSAAALYLALSGFGVATQRAFIMAAVAFGAILIDRPAVTIRGLGLAACLVLLLRPESLFDAGFQMSFAAAAALVAGYDATRPFWRRRAERTGWAAWLGTAALATLVTSAVAGAATAPFAAYHFNRLVLYGLPANLLATPVMGLWIMPAVIAAAALAPFGWEEPALAVLGAGIGYVLWVADVFAALEGAVVGIPAGTPVALALIAVGGLWLVIWRGRLRLFGMVVGIAGVLFWGAVKRPDLLISADAALIGGRTESGALWLSRERASGYAAELWLRRDGDLAADQATAYARRLWQCRGDRCEGETAHEWRVLLLRGTSPPAPDACAPRTVFILPETDFSAQGKAPCLVIDRGALDGVNSVAVSLDPARPPELAAARRWRLSVAPE